MQAISSTRSVIIVCLAAALLTACASKSSPAAAPTPTISSQSTKAGGTLELTSSAFNPMASIPAKYTCDGANLSPPLTLAGIPAGTADLALIVDDPDAPGGDWVHWLVWNIDPRTASFAEGATPAGAIEGVTSFGHQKYGGPCPPSGSHRYQFTLYALDKKLALSNLANKSTLLSAMQNHILTQTTLTGVYQRQ